MVAEIVGLVHLMVAVVLVDKVLVVAVGVAVAVTVLPTFAVVVLFVEDEIAAAGSISPTGCPIAESMAAAVGVDFRPDTRSVVAVPVDFG